MSKEEFEIKTKELRRDLTKLIQESREIEEKIINNLVKII
jgi:hypothetical protein